MVVPVSLRQACQDVLGFGEETKEHAEEFWHDIMPNGREGEEAHQATGKKAQSMPTEEGVEEHYITHAQF